MLTDIHNLATSYISNEYYAISTIVFLHGGDCFTRKTIHTWSRTIKTIIHHETQDWKDEPKELRKIKRKLSPDRFEVLKDGGCLDISRILDYDFYCGWVIIRLPNLHINI